MTATAISPKKKSSKREEQRRIATYKVNNCKDSRLQITPGQLSAFVRSIEGNNGCQFGIVKLCGLDLDILYPNPNIPDDKSTLIRFAAKLGRDGIVASLLRGGADPTSFSCTCEKNCTSLYFSTKVTLDTHPTRRKSITVPSICTEPSAETSSE